MDAGSRTVKVAVLEDGCLVETRIADTGVNPLQTARQLLGGLDGTRLVATGYSRHLLREHLGCSVVTEIRAHALGVGYLFPNCHTVVDVGGQDSKVIRIAEGGVADFQMNDRCAAGTGRFLEVMASALRYELSKFARVATETRESVAISSMCTVFAESEVIGLVARGEERARIARGLHESVVTRLVGMVGRVGVEPEVVFTGGVALNCCMVELLGNALHMSVRVPPDPQITGALGAALECARILS
ncbi:MAG: acyl-CoA dehydratase activase [candidate division WOR-3 bacterium]